MQHPARYWRVRDPFYSLTGSVCTRCGAKHFPPRDICPACSGPGYEALVYGTPTSADVYSAVEQALLVSRELWPFPVALAGLGESQSEVRVQPVFSLGR